MSVDLQKALAYRFPPINTTITEKDAILYALGVGSGFENQLDPKQLQYTYENSSPFKILPTMGVVFPFPALGGLMAVPGLTFNPMMLLHGEQYLELKKPIPSSANLVTNCRLSGIYDKGKAALVVLEGITKDEKTGEEICMNQFSLFIRGIGGFGGERGPTPESLDPPKRKPDAIVKGKTTLNQALLYRLSGDPNPLHADPSMASMGGFEKPILHGLCSFGYAGRAIIENYLDGNGDLLKSIRVRFSKSVYPGETILTEMWKIDSNKIIFQCRVEERPQDGLVISNACAIIKPNLEKSKL